jgi:hypothetical protein
VGLVTSYVGLFLIGLEVSCLLLLPVTCMLYSVLFGIYACFESELWIFPPEQIWMKQTWIQEELMHPSSRTRLVRRTGIKIKFHYVDAMGSEENTGSL